MNSEALSAVRSGNVEKLHKLLSVGAAKNINAQDHNGHTLLHHAVMNATTMGHHDAIFCLIEHGANTLIRDQNGSTVLHLGIMNIQPIIGVILDSITRDELCKLLDMKIQANGYSALHIAAKFDYLEQATMLLYYGANFESTNKAGKKPIDLAPVGELRNLLQIIHSTFNKAERGDTKMLDDLMNFERTMKLISATVLNCKNNEGHTLMQTLVLREHKQLALKLIRWRVSRPIDFEHAALLDSNRTREVDRLVDLTRDCRDLWVKRQADMMLIVRYPTNQFEARKKVVKIACGLLEKLHDLLLAFREFGGKQKFFPMCLRMKALEEMIELLFGIDSAKKYNFEGQENGFYEKLPLKWKTDIASFMELMNTMVIGIDLILNGINRIRLSRAVINNDVDKVRELLKKHSVSVNYMDNSGRTMLYYAVELDNKKMVKMLLKAGAESTYNPLIMPSELRIETIWKSVLYAAVINGNLKIVKMLLEKTEMKDLSKVIDVAQEDDKLTPLHAAAKLGRLDIVKILLKYGATYCSVDAQVRTPMEVSNSKEVKEFLKLVDECFQDAKKGEVELVHKLKAMEIDDFLAIAGTKNRDDQTLAVVAVKADAKSIAGMILRMIREAKQSEK